MQVCGKTIYYQTQEKWENNTTHKDPLTSKV